MPLTFFELNHSRDMAEIAIVPVSFDATTSYRAGARDGATAILLASPQLESFDEETLLDVTTKGIYTHSPIGPLLPVEDMIDEVQKVVRGLLEEGKFVVTLGGEHSISIGSIRAYYDKFGPLNIIQFDAHADLRDTYLGTPYNHGCVIRRVYDLGNIIQIGIRAISKEEWEFVNTQKNPPFFAKDYFSDPQKTIEDIIKKLKNLPTYITFDLDCFDPSIMPSVGTPVPGGLLWYDTLKILKKICQITNVVGFDIVELSPISLFHSSDFLAASLLYKLLNYVYLNKA